MTDKFCINNRQAFSEIVSIWFT